MIEEPEARLYLIVNSQDEPATAANILLGVMIGDEMHPITANRVKFKMQPTDKLTVNIEADLCLLDLQNIPTTVVHPDGSQTEQLLSIAADSESDFAIVPAANVKHVRLDGEKAPLAEIAFDATGPDAMGCVAKIATRRTLSKEEAMEHTLKQIRNKNCINCHAPYNKLVQFGYHLRADTCGHRQVPGDMSTKFPDDDAA